MTSTCSKARGVNEPDIFDISMSLSISFVMIIMASESELLIYYVAIDSIKAKGMASIPKYSVSSQHSSLSITAILFCELSGG